VAERPDPKAAFHGHVLDTPWDMLHLAYFLGYALWNYLTTRFSFAQPGYLSEELEPWRENGQTWRRLKVKFPAHIAQGPCEWGPEARHRSDVQVLTVGQAPACQRVARAQPSASGRRSDQLYS
jgi:hypothetical protein